mmetsp:Transcript_13251/g.33809  ORF Transcript_13251/g.33809 Transcript_13251/m.33809 type:complete len:81 (+) Transcript_13251:270-512(+)
MAGHPVYFVVQVHHVQSCSSASWSGDDGGDGRASVDSPPRQPWPEPTAPAVWVDERRDLISMCFAYQYIFLFLTIDCDTI